jgi:hypothetical protein
VRTIALDSTLACTKTPRAVAATPSTRRKRTRPNILGQKHFDGDDHNRFRCSIAPRRAFLFATDITLVDRYVRAWEAADLDGFVSLLREDARLAMPPWSQWYRGRPAIRSFFAWAFDWAWRTPQRRTFRLVPTTANGQIALYHLPQRSLNRALYSPSSISGGLMGMSRQSSSSWVGLRMESTLRMASPTGSVT